MTKTPFWNLGFILKLRFWIWDFQQRKAAGFTLMEMVVSLGIFSAVMLLSVGALVSVQNAQIRSSDVQTVHDNIRFTLELMTKEIRQGRQYAGFSCAPECGEMRFLKVISGVEKEIGYCANAGKLVRFIASAPESQDCSSGAILTADEATVEGILFYIRSQGDASDGQARATITMRVSSKSSSQKVETVMDLQTTVVQRLREG